jgi:hypothetical protein
MPETPENPDSSDNDKRHWLDHAAVWAAAAAALAAATAAGVGTWQGIIANQQLAVSKDTELRQLRAYVLPIPDVEPFKKGQNPVVTMKFHEIGSTPAYDIHATAQGGIFRFFPFLSDRELAAADVRVSQEYKAALYPTSDDDLLIRYEVAAPIDELYDAVYDGKSIRFGLTGEVTYQDAFGCKRRLRYCIGIGGPGLKSKECADRNESDNPGICTKE